jgi:hypothetical protein
MIYTLNDAELAVPEPLQDRTVNVLLFGTKQPPEFNLVISREFLPNGEKFEYVVKKQIDAISAAQEDFKQTAPERKRELLKQDGSKVEGSETAVSYKTKGHKFFQRHLYIPLGGKKIMIIAGTVLGSWEPKDETTWNHIVNSIRLK